MANSRIMLVCKHCGDSFCIGKGYFGSYHTVNEKIHEQLNEFYGKHEQGLCSDDVDASDNARNHFIILEEGEELHDLAADVVPKSDVDKAIQDGIRAFCEAVEAEITADRDHAYDSITERTRQKESHLNDAVCIHEDGKLIALNGMLYSLNALKKKYTEEKE